MKREEARRGGWSKRTLFLLYERNEKINKNFRKKEERRGVKKQNLQGRRSGREISVPTGGERKSSFIPVLCGGGDGVALGV